MVVHHDRDPVMLYPELAEIGWSAEPHGGAAGRGPPAAAARAVSRGGAFLGDARSRLLPASIPLRFFGAAVVFHLLAWLTLAPAPRSGWVLPAGSAGRWRRLHLLTLGVLGMTALGAGAQLLPVATRQPAPPPRLLAAIWWLYTPGVAVLALGMGLARPHWLAAGAVAVALGVRGCGAR